jgi:UDP-glucose 4-epimerase
VLFAAMGRLPYVTIFGDDYPTPDGTPIRDYIHVADLAGAHARALEYLRGGGRSQFLNVGTGNGISVLEVIECAKQVTGRTIPVVIGQRRPGDHTKLVADASLIKTVLGWTPTQSDLDSIVRSAWEWRVRHPSGHTSAHETSRPAGTSSPLL